MLDLGRDLELLTVPTETADAVAELVLRYDRHRDQYRTAAYNEARVRQEFINPFFAALGWDMDNRRGYAEAFKEVIHEDTVRVGGVVKAPDYCFRYGQQRKFYVEAKAPSVNLKTDASPAYQLRRYGWSAKLPLSVLTDFEEFAIYDCRVKPGEKDAPALARVGYLTYDQYLDNLPALYSIFAYEAIPKGFFDRYAEGAKGKRGTSTVDAEFLKEIEQWRDELARNIALRNALSVHELNYAVQTIIDRILFLRIAEDRGLEPENRLQQSTERQDIYADLCGLFQAADDKYNSGLFNFTEDTCTPNLQIDNKVLKSLITRLYYPYSPYEFSVIGADILGAVYEQFLGKVIRLTTSGLAKVEEKPEVKKAGGVYYTPRYIVDYIVEHTVGEAVSAVSRVGRTSKSAAVVPPSSAVSPSDSPSPAGLPRERGLGGEAPAVSRLRILDPACGSGSFLLGAYDWLLNWHLRYYLDHEPEKQRKAKRPVLVEDSKGEWRLSTAERKRILLDNLYGVDIDPQAVEVTKLNLLLKCLEGETEQTLQTQQQMFHERVLPNINGNIKCGNSLIGPDYYTGRMDYDEDEQRRVNAFDWQREFPEIMKAGGFDCVIGNPPYILLQDQFRDQDQLDYCKSHFRVASYKVDTYHLFMEKAVLVAKIGGLISLITPSNFLTNNYLTALRHLLLADCTIKSLWNITGGVFHGVSVDNAVFVVEHGTPHPDSTFVFAESDGKEAQTTGFGDSVLLSQATCLAAEGHLITPSAASDSGSRLVLEPAVLLGEIANVNFGMQLRDRREYVQDVIEIAINEETPTGYARCLTGGNVSRYALAWRGLACLEDRAAKRGGCWDLDKHHRLNKILTRQIGRHPDFALDQIGYNCLNTMFMINLREGVTPLSVLYVLGILNSNATKAYWLANFYDRRRTFPKIKGTYLEKLPIRPIDFANPSDVAKHDQMVSLVQTMLDLNERLPLATTPRDRDLLQRQIADTDAAIDRLVYELYDLTAEEIAIVEGQE